MLNAREWLCIIVDQGWPLTALTARMERGKDHPSTSLFQTEVSRWFLQSNNSSSSGSGEVLKDEGHFTAQ